MKNKKGQMELIGLAFVVVIMILGLMLYIGFAVLPNAGGATSNQVREAANYGSALHTAMLATTIPRCDYSLGMALERCATNEHLRCGSTSVCDATRNAWEEMLKETIGYSNVPYTARIEQSSGDQFKNFVHNQEDCEGVTNRLAAPSQPISTNIGLIRSVIEFC